MDADPLPDACSTDERLGVEVDVDDVALRETREVANTPGND